MRFGDEEIRSGLADEPNPAAGGSVEPGRLCSIYDLLNDRAWDLIRIRCFPIEIHDTLDYTEAELCWWLDTGCSLPDGSLRDWLEQVAAERPRLLPERLRQ